MCLSQFSYLRFENPLMQNAVISTTGNWLSRYCQYDIHVQTRLLVRKMWVWLMHINIPKVFASLLSCNFCHLARWWLAWQGAISRLSPVMESGQTSEETSRCLWGLLRPRLWTCMLSLLLYSAGLISGQSYRKREQTQNKSEIYWFHYKWFEFSWGKI